MWDDVKHYVSGPNDTFHTFVKSLQFNSILTNYSESFNINQRDYEKVLMDLHAYKVLDRNNDEKGAQAFVHSILQCAAFNLNQRYSELNKFFVQTEPRVLSLYSDRVSDEAVMRTIYLNKDIMCLLVEVKGTISYPYGLQPYPRAASCMSQLIQQLALSRYSALWKDEIICGIVSAIEWNLFKVKCSPRYSFKFVECYRHFMDILEYDETSSDTRVSVMNLIKFIMFVVDQVSIE